MKKILSLFLSSIILLCGCANENHIDRLMKLRKDLLQGNGCSFTASVSADYGEKIFQFKMDCICDAYGNLNFTVKEPESVAGISGQISTEEGKLIFDDQVLSFDLLTEDLISPISTPWLLIKTLRSGYIDSGGIDSDLFLFHVDDSYEENPLRLDLWLNQDNLPVHADIIWDGRRAVSVDVENFCLL